MHIAICDDEIREREQLLQIIQEWDPSCKTECFSSGVSLLRAAESAPPFDIAFLDIYMPGENGVDVAETLREISPKTGIVFVTTSRDHAVNAFSSEGPPLRIKLGNYMPMNLVGEVIRVTERFTICLPDVMTPGMNGIEAARDLRRFDEAAEIIFLSSSPDFAYESYGVRARCYPLKPAAGWSFNGYGCRSIRTVTEAHQGIYEFSAEDGIFTLRVVLPI